MPPAGWKKNKPAAATGVRKKVTAAQKAEFWRLRESGMIKAKAARAAGFSVATAHRIELKEKDSHQTALDLSLQPEPSAPGELCPEAQRALTTFAYFQRRYFGRITIGWQVEAAEQMVDLLHSDEKSYVVVNAPPGSGKSALFTHDFCAWVTVRDRGIRGQIGSLTMGKARDYLRRLKTSFERTLPQPVDDTDLRRGLALEPEAALAMDYGRFKPVERDSNLWSRTAFIVVQPGGRPVAEKEATWSAYGKDSGFLGARQDLVIWDDLMDPSIIRTIEARDELKRWWGDIAETRLEPGGLLILQGQRMGSDDIYRSALDQRSVDFDDDGEEIPGSETKKYHHIIFKAHYDTRCKPEYHKIKAPAYPEGCLINPGRLTWKELATLKSNGMERFQVLYQQEEMDPADILVSADWITGANGHVGCLTRTRGLREVPRGIANCLSVVTCDPSPTNRWGVLWFLIEPESNRRFLMDIFNGKMEAPDLLDYDQAAGEYTGLMPKWQKTSRELGVPITHWVVEINAAQRFMLQYQNMKNWRALTGVQIMAHTTGRNKSDSEYGVETIAPNFEHGRYRLPFNDSAAPFVKPLIMELTHYGQMRTNDLVMATWFLDWNLPLIRPQRRFFKPKVRPSWVLAEASR